MPEGFTAPKEDVVSVPNVGFSAPSSDIIDTKKKPIPSASSVTQSPLPSNDGLDVMGATIRQPKQQQAPTGATGASSSEAQSGSTANSDGLDVMGATLRQPENSSFFYDNGGKLQLEEGKNWEEYKKNNPKAKYLGFSDTKGHFVPGIGEEHYKGEHDVLSNRYYTLKSNEAGSASNPTQVPTGATGAPQVTSNQPIAGINSSGTATKITVKPKTVKEAVQSINDFSIKAKTFQDLQALQKEKMQDPDIANFLQVAQAADKGEPGAKAEVERLLQSPKIQQGVGYIQEMQGKINGMQSDLQAHQDEIQQAQKDLSKGNLDDEKPKSLLGGLKKSYYGGFAGFYKSAVTLEDAIGKAVYGKDYKGVDETNSNALKLQHANEAKAAEQEDAPNTTAGAIAKGIGGLPSMMAGLLAVPETKVPQFVAYMGAGGAIKGLQDQQDKYDASGVKTSLVQDLPAAAKEGLKGAVDGALMELSMGGSKYFNGIYKPLVSGTGIGGYEAVKSKILNGEVNLQDVISNAVLAGGLGFAHLDGIKAGEPLNAENIAKAKDAIGLLKDVKVDANSADAILKSIGHPVETIGDIDALSDHDKALIINDPSIDKYTREKVMTVEAGNNLGQSPEQTFFSVPSQTLEQVINNPITAKQARKQAQDLRGKTSEDPHEAEQNELAAKALDKMADIKDTASQISSDPQKHIDAIEADNTLTPEEKDAYKSRIEIAQQNPTQDVDTEQPKAISEQQVISEVRPTEPTEETNAPNEENGQEKIKPKETRETVHDDEENPHDILVDEHGNWKYADDQPEGATPENKIDWDATNKAAAKVHSENLLDALHSEFGGKYSTQETNWVDEDGHPVTMKLRIADHSENRAAGRGGDDYLSFVTDKFDKTANKFSGSQSYRNTNISEMSPAEAIAHIKEEIANYRPTDAKENGYKLNEPQQEVSPIEQEGEPQTQIDEENPTAGFRNIKSKIKTDQATAIDEVAGKMAVDKDGAEYVWNAVKADRPIVEPTVEIEKEPPVKVIDTDNPISVKSIDYDSPDKNKYRTNEQLKFNQGGNYKPVRIMGEPDLIFAIAQGSATKKLNIGERAHADSAAKQYGFDTARKLNDYVRGLAKEHRTTHTEKILELSSNFKENVKPVEAKPKADKAIFENALDDGLIEYHGKDANGQSIYEITEKGKKISEAIDGRLATRKGVKAGTDMFPHEAAIPEFKARVENHVNSLSDKEVDKLLDNETLIDETGKQFADDAAKARETKKVTDREGATPPEPVPEPKSPKTAEEPQPDDGGGGGEDKQPDETQVRQHGNSLKERVWKSVMEEMIGDTDTPQTKRGLEMSRSEAEARLAENPNAGKEAVEKLQERVPTDAAEKMLVLKEGVEAKKEYNRIYGEIKDAQLSGDKAKEAELKTDWARTKDYLDKINKARNNAASSASENLRVFKSEVNDNFDLAEMETEKRLAKGRPLTDKEFDALKIQHEQLIKAHAEMERVLQEQKDLYEGKIKEVDRLKEQLHSEAQRGLERKAQKARKAVNIEEIQTRKEKAIKDLKQIFKDRSKNLNSDALGISAIVEYAKPIADLASAYIDGGMVHLDDIASNIRNDIKDFADDVSIDDIKNIISQELAKTDPRVKAALSRWKTLEGKYEKKAANKDFKPDQRTPPLLTKEAAQAKANYQLKKNIWERDLAEDKLKNRTSFEKGADVLADWGRASLLATTDVFEKLAAAGAWTALAINPLSRLIGSGIGKLFPKFAERVQYGADFSIRVEARALVDGIKSLAESKQIWDTHMAGIDLLDEKHNPAHEVVRGLSGVVGSAHYIVKNPIQNATFSASLQYRLIHIAKNGGDIHSPIEQWNAINGALQDVATESVRQRAIQDGKQSIFSEQNRFVQGLNNLKNDWGSVDRKTRTLKYGKTGKTGEFMAKEIMPVTKIPSNVVWQTFNDYIFGSLTGANELRKAYKAGIEKLDPKEAEVIIRELSKGSIGAVAMFAAVAIANREDPDNTIGGNFQKGVKNPNAKAGEMVINGHRMPERLFHNPVFLAMNAAVTASQVAHSVTAKNPDQERGTLSGISAAMLTTVGKVPFLGASTQLANIVGGTPEERSKAEYELVLSRLIPGFLPEWARNADKDEQGNPIQRDPKTVGEHIKMEFPTEKGRKSVPLKTPPPNEEPVDTEEGNEAMETEAKEEQ